MSRNNALTHGIHAGGAVLQPPQVRMAAAQASFAAQKHAETQRHADLLKKSTSTQYVSDIDAKIAAIERVKPCHLHPKENKSCKFCRKKKDAAPDLERLKKERGVLIANGGYPESVTGGKKAEKKVGEC